MICFGDTGCFCVWVHPCVTTRICVYVYDWVCVVSWASKCMFNNSIVPETKKINTNRKIRFQPCPIHRFLCDPWYIFRTVWTISYKTVKSYKLFRHETTYDLLKIIFQPISTSVKGMHWITLSLFHFHLYLCWNASFICKCKGIGKASYLLVPMPRVLVFRYLSTTIIWWECCYET